MIDTESKTDKRRRRGEMMSGEDAKKKIYKEEEKKEERIRFVCYRLVNDPYTLLYYCNYIK